MKKIQIVSVIIIIAINLVACASMPLVDSRGKSSANIEGDMDRYHDDYYTCLSLAEDNTNLVWETSKKGYNLLRAKLLWLPPKAIDKKATIVKSCLEGRGYSVLWQ